ncbi:MAG: hypothetical protein AAF542_04850 [Pseudomonadota bacterium]
MSVKYYLWALWTIATSLPIAAQSDAQTGGLGYRTHGYEIGQGNTHSGPASDYGHAHFIKPRYGNSAYYRSYHAHKDIIKENGGDIYAPLWYWHPYSFHDNFNYPGTNGHFGYATDFYSEIGKTEIHSSGAAIKRRLERTLDGKCFELRREENTELRVELPASECAIDSRN